MASYSRTMDFLHKKLLQVTTKDQEDKIVDWMVAEVRKNQLNKVVNKDIKELNKENT
jgi:hypothetical protein